MEIKTNLLLFSELQIIVDQLIKEATEIPEQRLVQLQQLAQYIIQKKQQKEVIKINFICTHNSRRSHLSQIWAAVAAAYYNIDVATYSGGTEATALAPQIANALKTAGFKVEQTGSDNPTYQFSYAVDQSPISCFSKTFDDDANPVRSFAAVMTCTEADKGCPFVPGNDFRLALPFQDPKHADGSAEEAAAYEKAVRHIGREMFYVMQQVNGSK